jgi:release factor glutamine methyltransferase
MLPSGPHEEDNAGMTEAGGESVNAGGEDVWTVGRLLTWTTDWLASRGSDSPRLDAEVLLAAVRGCPRIMLYTAFDEPVDEQRRGQFRELIRRRGDGEPVAYLVGKREFFSLDFKVTPATLIPRPETEGLVVRLLDICKQRSAAAPAPRVIDVGTGSAAVAVAVAKHLPAARVVATDCSEDALAVAAVNVEGHGVGDQVQLVACDLFDHSATAGSWDVIVSNPPYVREDEFAGLAPDVRLHEPRQALVGGPTGCEVIERLLPGAAARLTAGGWLLIEVGPSTAERAAALVAATPGLVVEPTLADATGLPRIIQARADGSVCP